MTEHLVDLPDTWASGPGALHGGWLLETLAEEPLQHVGRPHPVAGRAHHDAAPTVGSSCPVSEVLREGRSVARLVQAGWLDEGCEVGDGAGRPVAQARQLAMYRA